MQALKKPEDTAKKFRFLMQSTKEELESKKVDTAKSSPLRKKNRGTSVR
jgi:hypothetical protein